MSSASFNHGGWEAVPLYAVVSDLVQGMGYGTWELGSTARCDSIALEKKTHVIQTFRISYTCTH